MEDILQRSIEALHDCPQDAQQCGQPVIVTLKTILSSLSSTTRLTSTAQRCLMLKEQANEMIATYPYSEVPDYWRRLYMDATLLHVVSRLLDSPTLPENELLELVRLLDMANIVTAYFEQGRKDVLFDLLGFIQARLVSYDSLIAEERPTKKQRRHGKSPMQKIHADITVSNSTLLPDIQRISTYRLEDAPDMADLASHNEPFIVRGAVSDWPAISDPAHAWADSKYLLRIAGRGRIVPVEIGSSYTAEGWTQKMMDFKEFLERIKWNEDPPSNAETEGDNEPVLYLAQHDLFQQFPELLADVITPDYVWSEPGPPDHYPDYSPPNNAAGYTINAWMGPQNTYSPAHTDPFYNCYAQVVGRKHIWVAPPSCTGAMESKVLEQEKEQDSDDEQCEDGRNAAAQQFMDNTAHIDVFEASGEVDKGKAPPHVSRFRENVLPLARQAILEEGDLLYMPPKWWHSLKSLERSFSVSMWF